MSFRTRSKNKDNDSVGRMFGDSQRSRKSRTGEYFITVRKERVCFSSCGLRLIRMPQIKLCICKCFRNLPSPLSLSSSHHHLRVKPWRLVFGAGGGVAPSAFRVSCGPNPDLKQPWAKPLVPTAGCAGKREGSLERGEPLVQLANGKQRPSGRWQGQQG